MDPTVFKQSLLTLSVLNLVVSTEPVDVAESLVTLANSKWTNVRAVTRKGVCPVREYLSGHTLRVATAFKKLGALGQIVAIEEDQGEPKAEKAEEALDEVLHQDPKNLQMLYVATDLWPHLSEPTVMAAVQRIREQRRTDERVIKSIFIVVPSLDYVPEVFRPTFTVLKDEGLTAAQAKARLDYAFGHLSAKLKEGTVDETVRLCTGLTSSEVDKAIANGYLKARKLKDPDGLDITEAVRDYRKEHGR